MQNAHFVVGFPRDGTSQDKPGRDVPLSLCPGTKKFSCPGVPLSREKGMSKNPRTNYSVPGRPGTKFSEKMNRFPGLELHFPGLECIFNIML
jgi:hypothetical protein